MWELASLKNYSCLLKEQSRVGPSALMMPKCSPVRCTTLTLEQPVPESTKIQKHLQKGGSGVEPAKYPLKVKSENVFTTLEC